MQTVSLAPAGEKVLAKFSDGGAAIVQSTVGRGNIVFFGYWPGCTYWASPDRSDWYCLPKNWAQPSRMAATYPARISGAKKHVEVSIPCVEAAILESEKGIAVTLLNWTGNPVSLATVRIPGLQGARISKVKSAECGDLKYRIDNNQLSVTLPLKTVDVLMIYF
jgi:hypothetical protein